MPEGEIELPERLKEYLCTLDEATLEKAKAELNEDPKNRDGAIETLRTWINEQPHFVCRTGILLLLFSLLLMVGPACPLWPCRSMLCDG